MAKCTNCAKYEALDTWKDRLFKWVIKFFPQQVIDLSEEKYGRGFGQGYKIGFEHASKEFKPNLEKMWPSNVEGAPIRHWKSGEYADKD